MSPTFPDWLEEWTRTVEPVVSQGFVEMLREAPTEAREAVIKYPPFCVARCTCCGVVGVVSKAVLAPGGTVVLYIAAEREHIGRGPLHVGAAAKCEVIGYHAGLTSEVLRVLAQTAGDA
jgi:hypothetical protein